MTSEADTAGWYPDPGDRSRIRYWDGSTWTEHTAPLPATNAPPAGWYQAPDRPEVLRYWDGERWTGYYSDTYTAQTAP